MLVREIYEIFNQTQNQEERIELIKKLYDEKYCVGKNEYEIKNEKLSSIPFIKEIVKLEFKINTIADCESGGYTGSRNVFVHLEEKINHNKELITLLLSIAEIWKKNIMVCSKFHYRAIGGTIEDYVENHEVIGYEGNILDDIRAACGCDAPDISGELVDKHYYCYLYIDSYFVRRSQNKSNSGWGTEMSVYKVIIL